MTFSLILEEQPANRPYPMDTDLMRGFTAAINNNQTGMAMEYLLQILPLIAAELAEKPKPQGQEKPQEETPIQRSRVAKAKEVKEEEAAVS